MIQHQDLLGPQTREVVVIGGSIAGLSAAIYLGRAQRDTLVIDSAGQGTAAAQAINRDLFEESLQTHSLRRFREVQLHTQETVPEGAKG